MKIILHGYTGRMGNMVQELLKDNLENTIVAKVAADAKEETFCYKSLNDFTGEADIVIDFSNHAATNNLLTYCIRRKLPVVLCTTGQSEEEKDMIMHASKEIPVFYSANMSLGIAVLSNLAKRAAALFPNADIEIVEKHHNQKLDVPSGTALALANTIKEVRKDSTFNVGRHENGKRAKQEIGIHSLRMGKEVGTHEIYINNGNECLTLIHEANSRAVFAEGAMKAAQYLLNKQPGLYTMKELVGE